MPLGVRPKRVAIVAEGTWGAMQEKGYDNWTQSMVTMLEGARRKGREEPRAIVEVVPSVTALRERIGHYPGHPDIVIFRTRGIVREAHAIKRDYPDVKVVVFSGLLPEDEVIFVDKSWDLHNDAILSIILD